MNLKFFCLCLFFYFSIVSCSPSYFILAPKLARVGEEYEFSINSFPFSKSFFNFHYGIENQQGKVLVEKSFKIMIGLQRSLKLQIPEVVLGNSFNFFARASGALNFNASNSLIINKKVHSLFIQTDKYLYKPGQKVLFRCILINPDLKPYQGPVNITIFDQSKNKILKLLDQTNEYGVITNELPLSSITPLGQWEILAQTKFARESKYFQVAEYVLPKFEVEVLAPSNYLINEKNPSLQEDLKISIVSKYTYGKPVKGSAVIGIRQFFNYYYFEKIPKMILKTVELKDGKADLTINRKELENLLPSSWSYRSLNYKKFFVEANVTETVTGEILSGNTTFSCKINPYSLSFLQNSPNNFKPGFTYYGYLKLKSIDDSDLPLSELKNSDGKFKTIHIKATSTYYLDQVIWSTPPKTTDSRKIKPYYPYYPIYPPNPPTASIVKNFTVKLNENGIAAVVIPTETRTQNINLEAEIFDEKFNFTINAYKYLDKFETRDKGGIQVTLPDGQNYIKPNTEIKFSAKIAEPVEYISYEILGKGLIVSSQKIKTAKPKKTFDFTLFISKQLALKLAPEARFVFSYVTQGGELIADSVALPVLDYFANDISITFNKNSTEPGDENVVLDVNTSPDSKVGLLGVDQSVLLLSASNDLTADIVKSELKKYMQVNTGPYIPLRRFKRCLGCGWWPIWLGGTDTSSLINKAGLFFLTNLYVQKPKQFYYLKFWMERFPGIPGSPGIRGFLGPKLPDINKSNFDSSEPVSVRKDFPETFIWTDVISNSEGKYQLKVKVPDTITSWVTTGFSVNKELGLGISETPAKLTVVKPFFISLNLPYSIVRGEEFGLQVTVFNYYGRNLKADVTLLASKYFKVIDCVTKDSQEKEVIKSTEVPNNDATAVYFWVVATSLGQIPIEVKALAGVAADAMKATIIVKPEGQPQSYSTSNFIQLKQGETFNQKYEVTLPSNEVFVPGSAIIEVTLIGDIMGSTLNNIDNLLQMPYGCGEQTISTMAPDIYVMNYLTTSGQLTHEIETKALNFINSGYQRELTYQRNDGSFSAFGNNDKAGSVWLSAFVIKCFHQGKNYIPVEDKKIASTLSWIISLQSSNGTFSEAAGGKVIHTAMQGGSSSGVAMTAFVLISLLENQENQIVDQIKLNQSILLSTTYLENVFSQYRSDPYVLAIISYAFFKSGSSKLNEVLTLLDRLAINEKNFKYWKKTDIEESDAWKSPYGRPNSYSVEIASYVLLVYAGQKDFSKSLPIGKWLLTQRNAFGGFSSTQDTVLGLESLASFASLIVPSSDGSGITVSIKNDFNQQTHTFKPISKVNALFLQSVQLPDNTNSIEVSATGEGVALFQLIVKYNVLKEDSSTNLQLHLDSKTNEKNLTLQVDASWSGKEISGMVLIEINILTGYNFINDGTLKTQIGDDLKKIETSANKINIYLDELTEKKLSFNILMQEVLPVAKVKPALVKLYRYYQTDSGVSAFYSTTASQTWEGACPLCCP